MRNVIDLIFQSFSLLLSEISVLITIVLFPSLRFCSNLNRLFCKNVAFIPHRSILTGVYRLGIAVLSAVEDSNFVVDLRRNLTIITLIVTSPFIHGIIKVLGFRLSDSHRISLSAICEDVTHLFRFKGKTN